MLLSERLNQLKDKKELNVVRSRLAGLIKAAGERDSLNIDTYREKFRNALTVMFGEAVAEIIIKTKTNDWSTVKQFDEFIEHVQLYGYMLTHDECYKKVKDAYVNDMARKYLKNKYNPYGE